MSVCDPDGGMHELYQGFLPEHHFVEAPSCRFHAQWDEQSVVELATLVADHHEEIAAIVLEPIVQGRAACASTTPATCSGCAPCATSSACC